MADSNFKPDMDDYIQQTLLLLPAVSRRQDNRWITVQSSQDLDIGIDYRLELSVTNIGMETYFKNVQIRVAKPDNLCIRFYKNDTYQKEISRGDGPVWSETLGPRDFSPTLYVYFRVVSDPDDANIYSIASIGVYAEIVPQGSYWKDVQWKL